MKLSKKLFQSAKSATDRENRLQSRSPRSITLGSLLNPRPELRVHAVKHTIRLLSDSLMGITEMSRDILDEVILLSRLTTKHHPQPVSLDIVLIRNRELLGKNGADPFLVLLTRLDGLILQLAKRGGIVRVCAIISVDVHVSVTLERAEGVHRAVDGDLVEISAESVALGVWVGEETGLENGVGGGLDAGDHVGWGEGGLFDLGKIVLRVPV